MPRLEALQGCWVLKACLPGVLVRTLWAGTPCEARLERPLTAGAKKSRVQGLGDSGRPGA